MGRFDNMSIWDAAVIAYGGEELAQEFMDHGHRGSPALAVLGDANQFVDPSRITDPEQIKNMLAYLERVADSGAYSGPGL